MRDCYEPCQKWCTLSGQSANFCWSRNYLLPSHYSVVQKLRTSTCKLLIAIWQCNFMSVKSNNKKRACIWSDFLKYQFFCNLFLFSFTKVLIHNKLETNCPLPQFKKHWCALFHLYPIIQKSLTQSSPEAKRPAKRP